MPRPKKQVTNLASGMPVKPAALSEAASRNWDRLIGEMEASAITLIPGFRAAIAQAATIQADLEVAWEDIRANGRYIVSKTGVKKINPAVEDTHKLNEKLSRALYALGLTPKSLGGNAGKDTDNEPSLEDIVNGRA
jgi:P27 family predicted phage terminase small subunit